MTAQRIHSTRWHLDLDLSSAMPWPRELLRYYQSDMRSSRVAAPATCHAIGLVVYLGGMNNGSKMPLSRLWVVTILTVALMTACSSGPPVVKMPAYEAVGLASYYGRKFDGRRTASGERYNMQALTAAHRALAFGSKVEVTNLKNGRKVQVRINDRGPFVEGRIIDLSYAAAKRIGMLSKGVVKVKIRALPE